MSDRHRDALTHLSYGLGGSALGDNGGFVLLTGEVGTGKTTVSRCLMADLPESTQLAFILNPTLSSQELLATICDQLKIRYRKTGATLKTLTDKISEKLLKNHAKGINTLLIIDEAQHLEAEVLEQLRLLTNLETNTKKLLQVILIGQPELQQLLKRRDLRQLAQRITARYHLLPLNQQELADYIKHRLSVADCHRALFNKGALTTIHKLSKGIPRLINLLCHSALMEAYNSNNAVVDKKIVLKAASQALGDEFEKPVWWQQKNSQLALAASTLLLVLFAGIWLGQQQEAIPHAMVKKSLKSAPVNENLSLPPATEEGNSNEVETSGQHKSQSDTPSKVQANNHSNINEQNKPVQELVAPSEVVYQAPSKKVESTGQGLAKQPQVENIDNITVSQSAQESPENYQVEAVDGVSDDLLARFQAAIDDTENLNAEPSNVEQTKQELTEVKPLSQMPAWVQKGIPPLKFEQHIYASDGQGWVNVNGRDRYEGDSVGDGLTIERILPQQVILTYRGEKFSLPALTTW